MGSFERKLKRNQLRRDYEDFGKEWARAKAMGAKPNGKELGKKPGFNEFKRRLKLFKTMQQAEQKQKELNKEAEEKKIDLEWKEE